MIDWLFAVWPEFEGLVEGVRKISEIAICAKVEDDYNACDDSYRISNNYDNDENYHLDVYGDNVLVNNDEN